MTTQRAVQLEAALEELYDALYHASAVASCARNAVDCLWLAWRAGRAVSKLRPMPGPSPEAEERWTKRLLNLKSLCPVHGARGCTPHCPHYSWGHA